MVLICQLLRVESGQVPTVGRSQLVLISGTELVLELVREHHHGIDKSAVARGICISIPTVSRCRPIHQQARRLCAGLVGIADGAVPWPRRVRVPRESAVGGLPGLQA